MRDLQVAQVERVGHHTHALAGVGRGIRNRRRVGYRARGILFAIKRYRLRCTGNVVQHPGAVAVERAVHLLGAVGEAVEQLGLGDGAGERLHGSCGIGFGKRMRTTERNQAAVLAQEAPHHRILVGGVDGALGERGHQARTRGDGALVLRLERGGLHAAYGGDGLGGALRFHKRIRQALCHAAIRRVVFDIKIALALRAQGPLRPHRKLARLVIGAPRLEHGVHDALARHLGVDNVITRSRGIEQFTGVARDSLLETAALSVQRAVQIDLEQRRFPSIARLFRCSGRAQHGRDALLGPRGRRILRRLRVRQRGRHQLHLRDARLGGERMVGEQQADAHDVGKRGPLFAFRKARNHALRRHGQTKRRLTSTDIARQLHVHAHGKTQLLDGQRQTAARTPFAALMPGWGAIGHAARQVLLAHRDEQLRIGLAALVKPRSVGTIAHALAQQDEAVERRLYPPQLPIGDVGILLVADQIGQMRVLRGPHQTHRLIGDAALVDGEQPGLLEVFQQKPNGAGRFELRIAKRVLHLLG